MNKIFLTEVVLLVKSYNSDDLKDWLHWYLDILQFDHCHIFDNESEINVKDIIKEYDDKISYEKIIGWPNQYALYNRYVNNESKAWWVLTVDDDEFLYIADKFTNINDAILKISQRLNANKISIGWRNLFPKVYTRERTNKSLIYNSTGYNHNAVSHWQDGDKPVKTFVKTTLQYKWDISRGHCPYNGGECITCNKEEIKTNSQQFPTKGDEDLILIHYQFKSDEEWQWKCKNRKSVSNKLFYRNYPDYYKMIYNNEVYEDLRMIKKLEKYNEQ